jgi:hypothetical protein
MKRNRERHEMRERSAAPAVLDRKIDQEGEGLRGAMAVQKQKQNCRHGTTEGRG